MRILNWATLTRWQPVAVHRTSFKHETNEMQTVRERKRTTITCKGISICRRM